MNRIKTSFKPNFLISLMISSWLFLFTVLIKPFQLEPLINSRWITMALGYSIIALFGYLTLIPLQNKIFTKANKWNLKYEFIIFLLFFLLTLIPSYLYHKSDFTNGIYNFFEFSINIFLPTIIILTPIIIVARIHLIKLVDKTEDFIIINGTYKLDYLKIKPANLVCVSSSKNYVDIYYLNNGILTKKVIRASLKKIEKEVPLLTRVHRSHLINPNHFLSWKNNNTLSLTQIEIPITKTFKEGIKPF
ncbi:LytTR family DNA-binding domain-containing protein [uncultured Psychroserpens sp.]|uniref:LytTR family DNA-binding domain-containing protein n=1 Tax=uncultured Psychroserpens sp. TaxID=255436 RepID=UPI00260CC035|nr:LytTR family DNA-binding domain-containing protein [uncultured Psychroserpens sp.]